jgi:carboxymethylenebutenolidase
MQGHFANKDDWCTPEVVNTFEKKMASGGNKPEVFRYDAQHAFANEKSPAYDAPSAKASWERMMAFLGKHL